MHTHSSSCLEGPITKNRDWWLPTEKKTQRRERHSAAPNPHDPEIRTELVERVRREIAAGTYDTPEKWEAALDRMLDRLQG